MAKLSSVNKNNKRIKKNSNEQKTHSRGKIQSTAKIVKIT